MTQCHIFTGQYCFWTQEQLLDGHSPLFPCFYQKFSSWRLKPMSVGICYHSWTADAPYKISWPVSILSSGKIKILIKMSKPILKSPSRKQLTVYLLLDLSFKRILLPHLSLCCLYILSSKNLICSLFTPKHSISHQSLLFLDLYVVSSRLRQWLWKMRSEKFRKKINIKGFPNISSPFGIKGNAQKLTHSR